MIIFYEAVKEATKEAFNYLMSLTEKDDALKHLMTDPISSLPDYKYLADLTKEASLSLTVKWAMNNPQHVCYFMMDGKTPVGFIFGVVKIAAGRKVISGIKVFSTQVGKVSSGMTTRQADIRYQMDKFIKQYSSVSWEAMRDNKKAINAYTTYAVKENGGRVESSSPDNPKRVRFTVQKSFVWNDKQQDWLPR
jgi:hypothetical protein